jgi:hypothetical protein
MPTDSSDAAEKEKQRVIAWAHQTISYCLAVYNVEAARTGATSPTQALSLAHDFWDRAVNECGLKPEPGHVELMCARIVLDWCAGYRSK